MKVSFNLHSRFREIQSYVNEAEADDRIKRFKETKAWENNINLQDYFAT